MRARTLLLQFLLIAVCILLGVALERRYLAKKLAQPLRMAPTVTRTTVFPPAQNTNRPSSTVAHSPTDNTTTNDTALMTLEQISTAIDNALTNRLFNARQA